MKSTPKDMNDAALIVSVAAFCNNSKTFRTLKGGQKAVMAEFIQRFTPFKPIAKRKR